MTPLLALLINFPDTSSISFLTLFFFLCHPFLPRKIIRKSAVTHGRINKNSTILPFCLRFSLSPWSNSKQQLAHRRSTGKRYYGVIIFYALFLLYPFSSLLFSLLPLRTPSLPDYFFIFLHCLVIFFSFSLSYVFFIFLSQNGLRQLRSVVAMGCARFNYFSPFFAKLFAFFRKRSIGYKTVAFFNVILQSSSLWMIFRRAFSIKSSVTIEFLFELLVGFQYVTTNTQPTIRRVFDPSSGNVYYGGVNNPVVKR